MKSKCTNFSMRKCERLTILIIRRGRIRPKKSWEELMIRQNITLSLRETLPKIGRNEGQKLVGGRVLSSSLSILLLLLSTIFFFLQKKKYYLLFPLLILCYLLLMHTYSLLNRFLYDIFTIAFALHIYFLIFELRVY